jgi:hypothetical protein
MPQFFFAKFLPPKHKLYPKKEGDGLNFFYKKYVTTTKITKKEQTYLPKQLVQ